MNNQAMMQALNNIFANSKICMHTKDDDYNKTNHTATIINKRTISIVVALSLSGLTLLAGGLAPTIVSAQPIQINRSTSMSSSQSIPSPSGPPPPKPFPPPSPELSAAQISASTNKTCTLTSPSLIKLQGKPQQTEGPYFVEGMPNRSDIRPDPSDGSVQPGIPLRLVIHVYGVDNGGSCTPLKGARVDIWHANYQGVYSGVKDQGTTGKKFLRGYQVTDDNGTVRFTTIYPGWYQGRAIHIHDKVRTFEGPEKTLEWTSQLYFDNSINEQVHTQPPYSKHGLPDRTNEQDGIYTGASTDGLVQSNSGKHLMLNLTREGQQLSYLGTFNIVLNSGQSRH
jgi:protocatechuate 3,4-dioxygenase beta subunit